MSLIGIICSDEELNDRIRKEYTGSSPSRYILKFPETAEAVLEFLNYDLPEIVIINFADSYFDLEILLSSIQQDSWLHSFGIIGIFDNKTQQETEVLRQYKDLNILAMLDYPRFQSHLLQCTRIIEGNRQLIFQRDLEEKFMSKLSTSFLLKNNLPATSVYASIAATALLQRGYIKPEAKMHLQLCLSELLVNAVEHGNCGIDFEEKSKALNDGIGMLELVEEKLKDPVIARKRVEFEWVITQTQTKFIIRDEGNGFNVLGLRDKIEQEGPLSLHGRGIRLARHFASKLMYNKKGNMVVMFIDHDTTATKNTPVGFSAEEVVTVKQGDIIFRETETSDFLYYIASGQYSVYHQSSRVGSLGPEDIFMGEMSFLLNNRRSAEVIADTAGKLIKISRRSFISVIKEYPHYGIFLSKLLARKLVRANIRNSELPEPGTTSTETVPAL